MRKTIKGLSAILMTSVLAVSASAAAMTASASTLTIKNATVEQEDKSTHLYNAYAVMTGTLASDGKTLSNLEWGDGVNSDAFVAALKSFDNTTFGTLATTGESATNVAAKLKNYSNVEGLAKVFNTSGILVASKANALTKHADGKYGSDDIANGWYIVTDSIATNAKTPNDDTGITNVRSANLLQIVGNTQVEPKYSVPSLEKKIIEGSDEVDANQANIGDIITYQIKVPVPDMTGYNKYFYIVEDTLSKGLNYNNNSVSISYGGSSTPLTLDSDGAGGSETGDYYVNTSAYNETTGTKIEIVFENFLTKFKSVDAGTDIIITYTATLNDNAVITNAGNPNNAKLHYSNDPNHNYNGKSSSNPDEPSDTDVMGETPNDVVKTYTTAIKIKKVDQDGNPLKGATFTLTADNLNKVIVSAGTTFTEAADGTYWKLKNGSYTSVAPDTATLSAAAKAEYENDGKKYKKVETAPTSTAATTSGTTKTIVGTVDDSGILTFTGLGAGTYTLEETGVPDGYNKAQNVSFTLGNSPAPTLTAPNWTNTNTNFTTEDNMYAISIQNNKGIELPTTGGVGTTIFYIIGGLMISGALVLLIVKKRMSIKEK